MLLDGVEDLISQGFPGAVFSDRAFSESYGLEIKCGVQLAGSALRNDLGGIERYAMEFASAPPAGGKIAIVSHLVNLRRINSTQPIVAILKEVLPPGHIELR
jgi:hypothetical protein